MTQEIPQQKTGWCDECNRPIKVNQDSHSGLQVACECEIRSVRVAKATPEGWDL